MLRAALLATVLVLITAPGTEASGGLVLVGGGIVESVPSDTVCHRLALTVTAVFSPDDTGFLQLQYAGLSQCLPLVGGGIVGAVAGLEAGRPVVELTCVGTEAEGLSCFQWTNEGFIRAELGPHVEPLGEVSLIYQTESRTLVGTVRAV